MIKNKFILKSISLFLSFWMLLASTGFSVNFHYCEGEMVNWSVLSEADPCDHKQEVKSCCESEMETKCVNTLKDIVEKSDCCSSDKATMELVSEFNLLDVKQELTLPQIIIFHQFVIPISTELQDVIAPKEYKVPILSYRIEPPFIQSFLI